MTQSGGEAAAVPTVTLNDDHSLPVLGLSVADLPEADTERVVAAALEAGVRFIDTAAAYGNEAAVGRAVRASGIPRDEVFVASKLATTDQGFGSSQEAARASLELLGLDYIDLYQIHWPAGEQGRYIDSWAGLMKVKEDGIARSVGVCNFTPEHLSDVIDLTFVTPTTNQIELHPLLNQAELREKHAGYGIVTLAHTPLGEGRLLEHPTVVSVAQAVGRTPAQVLLRWSLQLGNVVLPRVTDPAQIAEDVAVFDFELTDEQMATLTGLDDGTRFQPDPHTYLGS